MLDQPQEVTLPVKLEVQELTAKGKELGEAVQKLQELEEQKKSVTRELSNGVIAQETLVDKLENWNTPEQQLEKDEKEWPGGKMCGYMLWVDKVRVEFFGANRANRPSEDEESNFKTWIQNRANP